MSSQVSPPPKTTFFDLPAELRNEIYSLAGVLKPYPILITDDKYLRSPSSPPSAKYLRFPALIYANRCFRAECLPMYFGGNRFLFFDLGLLRIKLETFDASVLRLIERIEVPDGCHVTKETLDWMAKKCEAKGVKLGNVKVMKLIPKDGESAGESFTLDEIAQVKFHECNRRLLWTIETWA